MMGKNNTKWIVIILLLLWAIYALWPTYRFNTLSQKEREKLENKGKLASIQHRAIRLGLDLKGGMHLTLEVDFPYLVEQLAKNKDPQFETILNEVRKELNISTEDFLTILERKFKEHNVPLNKYWGQRGESDGKILSFLDKEGKKAITRSMQILTNRIDQFGVSEPSITKMGSRRILVELPGIEKPEQARNLIKSTALLEFKLLKDPEVFSNTIKKIDRALAKEMGVS
ncbi:protein translocase subunit SecD, partial [candidate division KSB1 bacterium]